MRVFDRDEGCPKCGRTGRGWYITYVRQDKDYLLLECVQCGYSMNRDCLDAEVR